MLLPCHCCLSAVFQTSESAARAIVWSSGYHCIVQLPCQPLWARGQLHPCWRVIEATYIVFNISSWSVRFRMLFHSLKFFFGVSGKLIICNELNISSSWKGFPWFMNIWSPIMNSITAMAKNITVKYSRFWLSRCLLMNSLEDLFIIFIYLGLFELWL